MVIGEDFMDEMEGQRLRKCCLGVFMGESEKNSTFTKGESFLQCESALEMRVLYPGENELHSFDLSSYLS